MAKIKYNVKGVDSGGGPRVKPGMYICKIKGFEESDSQSGNGPMLIPTFEVVKNSDGSKSEFKGQTVKTWLLLEHEPSAFRLRQFLEAVGQIQGKKGETGAFDPDDFVGNEVQVQVKGDKDQDGDYMPRVGKVLSLEDGGAEEAGEEPEEEEEAEDEAEPEEEPEAEEEEEAIDLDELDRDALKALIKEEELGTLKDLGITKATTDDEIREIIAGKLGSEEEEAEDEAEPEEEPEAEEEEEEEDEAEAEPDGPDFDSMSRAELKTFIKDNELDVKVFKNNSDDDVREKVREAYTPAKTDGAPDYNSWDAKTLKAELKERGLELEGRYSEKKAIAALEADDQSDADPF